MFLGNKSKSWHKDGKASWPEEWEGPGEEEQHRQSAGILTPEAINGL